MTDLTMIYTHNRGLAGRLWRWLPIWLRRRTQNAQLHALSDHMLRDIGIQRDQIDRMPIRSPHDATRYSR